jgi:signal transduction histidine kinase
MSSTSRFAVDNAPYRKWTLIVGIIGSFFGAVVEAASLSTSVGSNERLLAYVVIAIAAGYELSRDRRTEIPLALAATFFGAVTLFQSAHNPSMDTGTSLALMIVFAVLFVTTRQGESSVPVMMASVLIAAYTIVLVIVEDKPVPDAAGKLLIGIPGQVLVIWITWSIIKWLADATEQESHNRKIQEALATCSHALLAGRDVDPLGAALSALLRATEADYVYVDVNRVDADGNITWEIVADAYGDNVPEGPDEFDDGDYSQFAEVAAVLSVGKPARLRVADLPVPLRHRYEAEGIMSELMAPIMIRGQWIGTIGYSDFWRDNEWTEIEEAALMRAADMVAAYWDRESAREGLEELAKAKDRFIATVSHELRTPLSAVVGFAETLAEGLDGFSTAEVSEMVDLISTQGSEVARLVDDLLTAERAASGNLTIKSSAIDIVEECRAVIESLRFDIELVIVDGSHELMVWADTLRTRQIVRNLLTNANRYGGEAKRVEIRDGASSVTVSVVDSGTGVRPLDAEHIFDPYYRGNTAGGRTDSVGLGLAVARQLARMMGGELVYMRRNGWTCFELSLPSAALVKELATADWG